MTRSSMNGIVEMNDSEKILSAFSELRFYKELVLDNLHFTPENSTEKEVADLVINGGDFIIAIQLKARNEQDKTTDPEQEIKWLTKKCKEAKKQVKESIAYIHSGELPAFENKRNQRVQLSASTEVIPFVVFMNDNIGNNYPHILLKHSEDGMDINCMSFSDFQKMCEALLSPMEIVEYLKWRLDYYQKNGEVNISIFMDDKDNLTLVKPTQGEVLSYQFIAEQYGIENDQERFVYVEAFTDMLHKLPSRVVYESEHNSSYPLILFFAHFNRLEIKEFVERVNRSLKAAQEKNFTICGSLRNVEQRYAIFFVSTYDSYALDMDFLAEIARKKGAIDVLLQVFCYWESREEFRIDYGFQDYAGRYL